MNLLSEPLPPGFGRGSWRGRAKYACRRESSGFLTVHDPEHLLCFRPVVGDKFERRTRKPICTGSADSGITRLILKVQRIEPAAREVGFHRLIGVSRLPIWLVHGQATLATWESTYWNQVQT